MRYTPAQVKEALAIKEEALRHWRKALPPLGDRRGYGPCFGPGDLLALKVVSELRDLGLNVGQIAPHASALFAACSDGAWFGLEDKVLVFDRQAMELVPAAKEGGWAQQTRVAVPLLPLIRELRQRLSEEEVPAKQPEIAFPPVGVAQAGTR